LGDAFSWWEMWITRPVSRHGPFGCLSRTTLEDGDSIFGSGSGWPWSPVIASHVGTRPLGHNPLPQRRQDGPFAKIESVLSPKGWNRAMQKLKRLLAMSHRELAHRIREKMPCGIRAVPVATGIPSAPRLSKSFWARAFRRFYYGSRAGLRRLSRRSSRLIERATSEARLFACTKCEFSTVSRSIWRRDCDWHRRSDTVRHGSGGFWTDYRPEHAYREDAIQTSPRTESSSASGRIGQSLVLTGEERFAAEACDQ